MSAITAGQGGPGTGDLGPVFKRTLSRRHFISGAGGLLGLSLAGLGGFEWPHKNAATRPKTSPSSVPTGGSGAGSAHVYSFVTRPDLRPQVVRTTRYVSSAGAGGAGGSPKFIFLATKGYSGAAPGQPGLMIVDRAGRLIWFKPVRDLAPFDFNVQTLDGNAVLTWWQGTVTDGYGSGSGQIADAS